LYGPLHHTETVIGVVNHTESERPSIGAGNCAESSKQVDSSLLLCDLTAVSVTNSCPVRQEDVSVSDVQPPSVGCTDFNARPAVGNQCAPTKLSELMSVISNEPSDTARDWSTGTLVTDGSGKLVQVIMMLFLPLKGVYSLSVFLSRIAEKLSMFCLLNGFLLCLRSHCF